MPNAQCCVVGCTNGTYQLNKWKENECSIHNEKHRLCGCKAPFKMLSFPTEPVKREMWIRYINRMEVCHRIVKKKECKTTKYIWKKAGDVWEPGIYENICSEHFIDGVPTDANPYPTEKMGSVSARRKSRKVLLKTAPLAYVKEIKRTELEVFENIKLEVPEVTETDVNPYATEEKGCRRSRRISSRKVPLQATPPAYVKDTLKTELETFEEIKLEVPETEVTEPAISQQVVHYDHTYSLPPDSTAGVPCEQCVENDKIIESLEQQILTLKEALQRAIRALNSEKNTVEMAPDSRSSVLGSYLVFPTKG